MSRVTRCPGVIERDGQFWLVRSACKAALCTGTKALPVSDSSSKSNRDARPCNAGTIVPPTRTHPLFHASVAARCIREIWRRASRQTSAKMPTRRLSPTYDRRRSSRTSPKITKLRADDFIQTCTGTSWSGTCVVRVATPGDCPNRAPTWPPRAIMTSALPSSQHPPAERRNFCKTANCSRRYLVCNIVSRFSEISSLFSECSPSRCATRCQNREMSARDECHSPLHENITP